MGLIEGTDFRISNRDK